MKDLLLVLFYQAIVSVNAAVILIAIIWLAKRKEEKDERKPNPDFTPPPTVRRGGYQPKPSGTPKPPTTGTNVIEPKRRWDSWDEDDAEFEKVIRYAVEHECSYQAAKLALASGYNPAQKEKPTTTGSAAIKPKCGISADEAAKLCYKLAEASARLGGNSELDEPRERVKDLADRLDRAEKKPVTPERLKEAGFGVEPVNVFNPAEESVKRYGAYFLDAKCRDCKHYLATDEEATTGLCGKMEEIVFADAGRACFEAREKPRTDHLCGDCCHFAASYVDEYEKPWGVCRKLNDPRHYGAAVGCGRWQDKPAPLGTVTTH